MAESIVAKKAYTFALESIKLSQLMMQKHEYVLSKQFLRSATSIGANTEEATAAVSRPDFINKMSIAQKEARESSYWLRLLHDSGYIESTAFEPLHKQCLELLRILNSITLTARTTPDPREKNS
jgi:four helix bundle protein